MFHIRRVSPGYPIQVLQLPHVIIYSTLPPNSFQNNAFPLPVLFAAGQRSKHEAYANCMPQLDILLIKVLQIARWSEFMKNLFLVSFRIFGI